MIPEKPNKILLVPQQTIAPDCNPLVLKYVCPYHRKIANKPTSILTLGVDSEFRIRVNCPNLMITSQVGFSDDPNECFVFEHPALGLDLESTWLGNCLFSTLVGWSEVSVDMSSAKEYSRTPLAGILILEMLFFYCGSDILRGQFSDRLCQYIQKYLVQDGRLRLESRERQNRDVLLLPIHLNSPMGLIRLALKLVDLSRLEGGSLVKTVLSLGLQMETKQLMDSHKKNMLVPYSDPLMHPQYVEYAKGDVTILFPIRERNLVREKELYAVHGLTPPEGERLSKGSLISNLFLTWLENYIGDHNAYLFFRARNARGVFESYDLAGLIAESSLSHFAGVKDSSDSTLSLLTGAMAKSLKPTVFKVEGSIADADFKSGYASIQQTMFYPLGLMQTTDFHKTRTEVTTLGQFLKAEGVELEDRLYIIIVSGKLNHDQSLVPSKVIDVHGIGEKYDDLERVPAEFRYYSREIINGCITSDVLQCLKNVCSDREWKEWMGLEVVAAAWYPKSYRCDSPEEWYEKTKTYVEEHGNEVHTKRIKGRKHQVDARCPYWLAVPLKEFLQPYADRRLVLKQMMNDAVKGTPEYDRLNAEQDSMKLTANTLYGVFGSLKFVVGNPVVGNNITAAMRVASWCGAMATGGSPVITDGFPYELNHVRTWNANKPSMKTLSLWRNPGLLNRETVRSLGCKPLGDQGLWSIQPGHIEGEDRYSVLSNNLVSWECKAEKWGVLNQLLKAHIIDFFRKDGCEISILHELSFEHKDVYIKALFHSQTNYRFYHATGVSKTKARGWLLNKGFAYNDDQEEARILALFSDLDDHPESIPPYAPQTYVEPLSADEVNRRRDSAKENPVKLNKLVTGDSMSKTMWLRPISLSQFCWQCDAQFRSWNKANEDLKEVSGYGIEQWFLNEDGTLNYTRALEQIQEKIDAGADWITIGKGRGSQKKLIKAMHPFYPSLQKSETPQSQESVVPTPISGDLQESN